MGVIQPRGDLDLSQKPVRPEHRRQFGPENLDRHLAVVLQIVSQVHGGHAPAAQLPRDRVSTRERSPHAGKSIGHRPLLSQRSLYNGHPFSQRPVDPIFFALTEVRLRPAQERPMRIRTRTAFPSLVLALAIGASALAAQQPSLESKLQGFDSYMAQVLKDWNVPGIGVGVVVKDKLVFAKGYGYRDYGKKLPYTPITTQPIASNTKLFTAVAAGFLVEDGKLD